MATFSWNVKHLKEDDRGYASTLFLELKGVSDQGRTETASSITSFGGDDYKPKSEWTQEQIDQWAETARVRLEEILNDKFNQGVPA
jgi:hypothetical protein